MESCCALSWNPILPECAVTRSQQVILNPLFNAGEALARGGHTGETGC